MGASERNWVEADSQADGVGERTLTLLPVENCKKLPAGEQAFRSLPLT